MTNEIRCPVTISEIFETEFQMMNSSDYELFPTVEGDGYTATIKDCMVVMETGEIEEEEPDCTMARITVIDEEGRQWTWDLPRFADQIL